MKKILFAFIVCLAFASCDSDDDTLYLKTATVYNSGNPAIDGCGWLLVIDSEHYKPVSPLTEEFQEDGLPVRVTGSILKEKGDCDAPNSIKQIKIKKIVEK